MLEFVVGVLALVFLVNLVSFILCAIPFVRRRFPRLTLRSSVLLVISTVGMLFLGSRLPENETVQTIVTDGSETDLSKDMQAVSTNDSKSEKNQSLETITAQDSNDENRPENVRVTFTSDPEGAELFVGSELKGTTPVTVELRNGENVDYQLVADRVLYKPFKGTLNVTKNENISVWIDRLSAEEMEARKVAAEIAAQQELRKENEEILLNKELEVKRLCESIVKDNLRAPSTAKFAGFFSGGWDYRYNSASGTATFTSYVDSQNGFGAMLRSQFGCSYNLETNTVTLEYFN